MDISYQWLKELTGLDWTPEQMADRLTLCGTACEYIEPTAKYLDKVIVGEVVDLKPVPNASKIKLATVNLGQEVMDVVCGAPNVALGQKVPVALEGAKLAGGMVIKKAKIRGIESKAMICSEKELGISDDHSGIMVLDSDAPNGAPLVEYLDYDDYILTFELTPNRGDSMSAIGIARDLAALASIKVKKPVFELKESSEKSSDYIKVSIEDSMDCPRYAARIIKNVKIAPSPWWIKKKLLTAGIRPISNIVDITNLVMLETGHPLHAFDLDLFGSDEVVVRRAKNKEKFITLDGVEHELTNDVLLITNGKQGVAAAGVMGGFNSEVKENTTNILLEAAYFDPSVIRKSRKKLGLVTESSNRFEKGTDPNGIPYVIDRAAYLFSEICDGEVLNGIVDNYPQKINHKKIKFRPDRCNRILGTDFKPQRMKQIFNDLELEVHQSPNTDFFEVIVPTFRPDLEREIDLIEEIVRIEGYDKVTDATTNIGPLYTPLHYQDRFKKELRQVLTASGFDEIISHGLAHSKLASILNPNLPQLKILNPVSEDLNVMRNSLIQTALSIISHNIAHRTLDLCLFEIGKIYFPPDENGKWIEEERLSLAVTGETPHTWREQPRPFDFYDISGALSQAAKHFGWKSVSFSPHALNYLNEDISFDIVINNQIVGTIGEILPKIAKSFDIKQPVFVAELSMEKLIKQSNNLIEYKSLPIYPAVLRDLALIVDSNIKAGDIVDLVKKTGGGIVESVQIFDFYTGKQIAKGKKSIAFSINYRSSEGSLLNEQVNDIQQVIIEKLKKEFNVEIRDK